MTMVGVCLSWLNQWNDVVGPGRKESTFVFLCVWLRSCFNNTKSNTKIFETIQEKGGDSKILKTTVQDSHFTKIFESYTSRFLLNVIWSLCLPIVHQRSSNKFLLLLVPQKYYPNSTYVQLFGALPTRCKRITGPSWRRWWRSTWIGIHLTSIVGPDCNLVCLTIDDDTDKWTWRSALGMDGWLQRWEMNGWRTSKGGRVRHSDIWKRILRWLRLFESSPDRCVEVNYVKAHAGEHGNERADSLAGKGAALRFKLMEEAGPPNWFRNALERYWGIRKEENWKSNVLKWMLVQKIYRYSLKKKKLIRKNS